MNKQSKKGVTLIELLLVMAIIGIMTSVVLVYLGDGKSDKELEGAMDEVLAVVRETQNNALTGKGVTSGVDCEYTFYYGAPDNKSYGFSGCSSASYSLGDNVVFDNSGSFSYSVPFGNFSGADTTIVLEHENTGKTGAVCADSSGIIEKGDIGNPNCL